MKLTDKWDDFNSMGQIKREREWRVTLCPQTTNQSKGKQSSVNRFSHNYSWILNALKIKYLITW